MPKTHPLPDTKRGLYQKYRVKRLNDPAGKHARCEFYVLDLVHDKFAADALEAYARGCVREYPPLARDVYGLAGQVRNRFDYWNPTNGAEINELRNRNAQLERALYARWTPVTERLPTNNYSVLGRVIGGPLDDGDYTGIVSYIKAAGGWKESSVVDGEACDVDVIVSKWTELPE
jgi:hypothetical protein